MGKINKPTKIIVHHTGGVVADAKASTQHHTVKDVDNTHRRRWPDFISELNYFVGYHYIITKDGKVTQTREIYEEGAHCFGMNTSSIGVCITGNYSPGSPDIITPEQITAFQRLVKRLMLDYKLKMTDVVNHRDYASYKDCPGDKFYDGYFRKLLEEEHDIALLHRRIEQQQNVIAALIALITDLLKKYNAKTLGAFYKRSSTREIIN